MADDMNMTTYHFIADLARPDRNDRNLTRFGALPFVVRRLGSAAFLIEDQRKWNPELASVGSMAAAIEYIAAVVDSERKAV
jgi:hypothetical protein